MGAVYLAEQIAVGNRPVAVKVLSRKLLDDPNFLLRFQNEAASTGRIHHPNVVTIYESGQADDGTPYIAMEFLEGESLRQALKRRSAPVKRMWRGMNKQARSGRWPSILVGYLGRLSGFPSVLVWPVLALAFPPPPGVYMRHLISWADRQPSPGARWTYTGPVLINRRLHGSPTRVPQFDLLRSQAGPG